MYETYKVSSLGVASSEPSSRSEAAYLAIRDMIRSGELAQGTPVTEAELARRLEVSRTPVREAMRLLSAESYVRPASGRGYIVVELGRQDLVNVYDVRTLLEGFAAERAAGEATRIHIAQLEDLYEAMTNGLANDDEEAVAQLNSQFHATIHEASGNTYLQSMLSSIRDVFERFRPVAIAQPARAQEAHAEHRQILDAISAHDADLARRLTAEHVQHALAWRLETSVDREPPRSPDNSRY